MIHYRVPDHGPHISSGFTSVLVPVAGNCGFDTGPASPYDGMAYPWTGLQQNRWEKLYWKIDLTRRPSHLVTWGWHFLCLTQDMAAKR
jgi:hypothetical protein